MPTGRDTGASARERLARRMRALRDERGLTQKEMGLLVSANRTYVGAIERCERNVSLDNIERLAEGLGVDICELLAAD